MNDQSDGKRILLTDIGDHAILVFRFHAVFDDLVEFGVAQFLTWKRKTGQWELIGRAVTLARTLTERQQDVCQFTANHGTVFGLVVQFQTFDKVFVHALVLVLLDLRVDRVEFVQLEFLFAYKISRTRMNNKRYCRLNF